MARWWEFRKQGEELKQKGEELRKKGREAVDTVKDPAVQRAGAAAFLIGIGVLGFVTFIIVALVSRSWMFSFGGMLVSLILAGVGVYLLNARATARLARLGGMEVNSELLKRR